MTRHELKDQVEHDQFTDTVSSFIAYASTHRDQFIRWTIVGLVVLVLAGGAFWYASYRNSVREQDLNAAFQVLDTPVASGNPADASLKTFPTQDAKTKASIKALSEVISKDGGTRQGFTAQYYLGTLKAQNGDARGAESDLNSVSGSSSACAPLAKIALAQLYAGENKIPQAQGLLRDLVNHPSDLVSKAQAQILLAHLDETTNPKEAKKILQSVKNPTQDPAVSRAVEQLSAELNK